MAVGFVTSLRTSRSQAIIDAAGASAKLRFYSGARPATGGAATTQLAEVTFGSVIGVAATAALNFGAISQTNSGHTSGTPTWCRLLKSDNSIVADWSIGSDMTFSGTIATGVDITLGASVLTEGNA